MAEPSSLLDLAALEATPVATDPFPHVVVRDFLPAAARQAVLPELPSLNRGGSFPHEALRLGSHARALMREMEGPALRTAIAAKFGLSLDDAPTMLTMRVYCRERDGQIHTDSTAKRVTVLLYLNEAREAFGDAQGCLRLLRRPDDLEDYAVEVPPVDGTLLVFPNGPTTWHGHRSYVGPRHSLQLNYMANDARARSEIRRHRFSAFVKRFALAA